jgi:hypothetical protein
MCRLSGSGMGARIPLGELSYGSDVHRRMRTDRRVSGLYSFKRETYISSI